MLPPLDSVKKAGYNFRTGVEWANGYMKDNLLPAKIFVKGFSKVSFVLMGQLYALPPCGLFSTLSSEMAILELAHLNRKIDVFYSITHRS